jgi:rhombotail lipoprotein
MNCRFTMAAFLLVLITLTGSCVTTRSKEPYKHLKTSIIRFLGPVEKNNPEKKETSEATITVPLKVGIAFVPSNDFGDFPEKERMNLMQEIAPEFENYKFVESIELIPSLYLEKEGGFSNLDRLQELFDINVIVLLSYDQSQFADSGAWSITYWTIVGAYIVKGEKNDTHTLIDASLFHIQSRKMLFRAAGINHLKSRATPINFTEQVRKDSLDSYHQARVDLTKNLKEKLYSFRKMIRASSGAFKLKLKPGYELEPLKK